jgi:hypothetical protein
VLEKDRGEVGLELDPDLDKGREDGGESVGRLKGGSVGERGAGCSGSRNVGERGLGDSVRESGYLLEVLLFVSTGTGRGFGCGASRYVGVLD